MKRQRRAMNYTQKERDRRKRAKRIFLTRVGAALVDVGRLNEDDEQNWAAIEAARDLLLEDYTREVRRRLECEEALTTSGAADMVPKCMVDVESAPPPRKYTRHVDEDTKHNAIRQ